MDMGGQTNDFVWGIHSPHVEQGPGWDGTAPDAITIIICYHSGGEFTQSELISHWPSLRTISCPSPAFPPSPHPQLEIQLEPMASALQEIFPLHFLFVNLFAATSAFQFSEHSIRFPPPTAFPLVIHRCKHYDDLTATQILVVNCRKHSQSTTISPWPWKVPAI